MAKYLWVGSTGNTVDKYSFNAAGNWRVGTTAGTLFSLTGTNSIPGPRDEVFVGKYSLPTVQPRGWIPARSPLMFGGFSGPEGPTGAGTWSETSPTGTTTGGLYGNGLASFTVNFEPVALFGATSGASLVQPYPFPDLGYHPNYNESYITGSIVAGLTATNNFRSFTSGLRIKATSVSLIDNYGNFTSGTTFSGSDTWLNGREISVNFVKSDTFGDNLSVITDQSPITVDGGKWNNIGASTLGHYNPLTTTSGSFPSAEKSPDLIRSGQGVVFKNCVSLNTLIENEGAAVSMVGVTAASVDVKFYGGDGVAYGSNGVPIANYGRVFQFIDSALTAQGSYSAIGYAGLTAPVEAGSLVISNGCYALLDQSGMTSYFACSDSDIQAMRSVLDTASLGLGQQVFLKSSDGQSVKTIDRIVTNPLDSVDSSGSQVYDLLPINIAFDGNCTVNKLVNNGAIVRSAENIAIDSIVRIGEMIMNDNAILDFDNDNSNFDDWRFGSITGSTINGGIVLNSSSAQILGSPGVRLWNTQTKGGSVYNARSNTNNSTPTAID